MKILQPKVTVNKLPAAIPAGIADQKILVVGQMLSAGGADPSTLIEGVSKSNVDELFGAGSFLQETLNSIFDIFEKSGSLNVPSVDVIPLSDAAGGTAATGSIAVAEVGGSTGAVDKTGTIKVIVGSKNKYTLEVDITEGDTFSEIAQAIAAAINAKTDLCVTASESTGTVTLTCRHKGTIGNAINIRIEGLLKSGSDYVFGNAGFTITGFASGATDPTLPTLSTLIGDNRYQTIVHPVQYGTSFSVANLLDGRFNSDNAILDGVAIVKKNDTLANHKTALGALNSQSLVYICDKTVTGGTHKGSAMCEFDFSVSARVAALRALRLTDGANISRFTIASSRGVLDAEGGAHIASLPYFNTPVEGVSPIDTGVGFTQAEIEELFDVGGTVLGNNVSGNVIIMGEFVTTYKTNSSGADDETWRFLNSVDTMSVSAELIFNNLKSDFAQTRLTEGRLIANHSMANATSIKAQMKKYYLDLADLALTPYGDDAVLYFLEHLTVSINLLTGKATISSDLPIVTQLREILANLRTEFSIN